MACVEVHLLAESLFVVADVDFKSGESARQTLSEIARSELWMSRATLMRRFGERATHFETWRAQ